MQPFSVKLCGSFYSAPLYDAVGREITDMTMAADFAENEFGAGWDEVFNGSEGIDRDEYLQLKGLPCLR
jgi:hypothetical protein